MLESVLDHFPGSIVDERDGCVWFNSIIDHFLGGIDEK
jgi:hypothetical protein